MTDQGWTRSEETQRFLGDTGPWVRHLAKAWQAAAAPGVEVPLPADPAEEYTRLWQRNAPEAETMRDDVIAYWAQVLHLLCFGLGWARPDRGLATWMERGMPTEDPVLAVVRRWWPQHRLEDFLAFTAQTDMVTSLGRHISDTGSYRAFNPEPLPDRYATRRNEATWQAVWGGGTDPLHLSDYTLAPITYPPKPAEVVQHWLPSVTDADPQNVPRMVVITDTYAAWHAALWHYRPTMAANGRSIRTDVVCKPVGWLGEYRQSSQTGAWFRGRHRWHMLGQ